MRFIPVLLLSLVTLTAAAQSEERGRLHFEAGASYYETGDYGDALREFQRAYELSQKPELFYNLSLCHQQLGDLGQATTYLERYLNDVEEIANRENLLRRLENFRARIAQAQTSEADNTGDNTGEGISPVAWIGFGIAGAGLITAAVAGGLALSEKNDLEDAGCGETIACDAGDLRARALVADLGIGLVIVGVTLGVVFLVIGSGGDDPNVQARVRVDPYAGWQGGGAVLSGSF